MLTGLLNHYFLGRFMLRKLIAFTTLLTLSFISTAGIITDTSNDSFIDETTGFEWMDFGVNNTYTYNEVSSLLNIGDEFEGWRIADEDDIAELMTNAFLGLGASDENPNYYGTDMLRIRDGKGANGSVLSAIFDTMGVNVVNRRGTKYESEASYGLFESSNGLGLIENYEFTGSSRDYAFDDQAQFRTTVNFDVLADSTTIIYSTMLIKNEITSAQVPEPTTLVIFAVGVLALLRFRSKNIR